MKEKIVKPATTETIEGIHERLQTLVRTVSGKYDLDVRSHLSPDERASIAAGGTDPDSTWFRMTKNDPKTGKVVEEFVYIPPTIIERSETEAFGKAAHEAAHVAMTRMEHFTEDMPTLPGHQSILMAVEERPTDQYVRDTFAGAGEWLDKARRFEIDKEPEFSAKGKVPAFAQLANIIVYEPHASREELGERYDEKALNAYEKIREEVERAEHTIPSDYSEETERIDLARERLRIVAEEIWPKLQEIFEEDIKNEMSQQLMNQLLKEKIEEQLKELLQSILEEILSELEKKSESEEGKQAPEDESDSPGVSDLSPELQQKIKEAIESLPEDLKEKLRQKAIEDLKEVEKELAKEMQADLSEQNKIEVEVTEEKSESTKTEPESVEKPKTLSDDEMVERLAKAREDMKKAEKIAGEGKKSRYDEVYRDVFDKEQKLYRQLEDIFFPNVKSKVKLVSGGSTPNLRAVFQRDATLAAGGVPDNRIFERRVTPEAKDYALTLLIDLSGSMSGGNKIQEAFKASVMLVEALNRVGITIEVLGFQDNLVLFKSADETFTDDIRKRMNGIELEVEGRNPGGRNMPSYNDDGPCLLEASERLSQLPQREKILMVVSDGVPSGRRSDERDLIRAISHVTNKTDIRLLALGLGSGTEHVKRYYPNAIANIDSSKFSEVVGEMILKALQE